MTLEKTLLDFEEVAEAPSGAAKLRNFILTKATKGELSTPLASDEAVPSLLERIAEEKMRHIEAGIARATRSSGGKGTLPAWSLPEYWRWATLDDVCSYIQRGRGPKYVESSSVPVVSQKCIQWSGFSLTKARFVDEGTLDKYGSERFLRTGDLLWNSTGTGTVGRVNVFPGGDAKQIVADSHVTVLRPALMEAGFIWLWLASPEVQGTIEDICTGTTKQKELGTGTVKAHFVPVPPLEEQRRIVAKVDELMALCDELEEKQNRRNQARRAFTVSAFDALANAESPDDLQVAWERVRENWGVVTLRADQVGELRSAVAQLAVTGRLTDSNTSASADALLKSIAKLREERDPKASRKFKFETIDPDDEPFELAPGWRWVRWGEIMLSIEAGWSPKCEPRPAEGTEWGVLKVSAVSWGRFKAGENKALPEHLEPRPELEVQFGDFIMSRANTAELVGRSVVVDDAPPRLLLSDKHLRVHYHDPTLARFINIVCASPYSRAYMARESTGTSSSMKNVSQGLVKAMPIPLPPLDVQADVVTSVERLLALCDELEAALTSEFEAQERFARAATA